MKSIILVICIFLLILCLIGIIKNIVTYNRHEKIRNAIYRYKIDCIRNHRYGDLHSIEYINMESYGKTFFRLWDWGYTRILPRDKFEIIKPYMR